MTKEAILHLQITGEVLSAPEHKSVLPLPRPAEEVTIKNNSSLTASILNSISGRCCLQKATSMDLELYLSADYAFSLIPPILQCDSLSLHFQTKAKPSIFSHLEKILPCYFSVWYLLIQK